MSPLYSIDEIVAATSGEARRVERSGIGSISIDSRDLSEGALFVAISGDRFDGHDFVDDAVQRGAAAALVSADRADSVDSPLIVVPDALEGLVALGRYARERSVAKIVAVTGSVGKTTTKEAIRIALSGSGATHAGVRSFNNHWGVPLTLARMPRDTAYGVFEIGMNHAGEITPLVQQVRPHVAVITTIAPAHIENLGSIEAIARAKAEIFSGVVPGGAVLINIDHDQRDILLAEASRAEVDNVVTYGFAQGSDWQITDYAQDEAGSELTVRHHGVDHRLRIGAAGRHMASNAAAALAASALCGAEIGAAAEALQSFGAPEGRGQRFLLGPAEAKLVLVDESYNANLASMSAALEVFRDLTPPGGRKIVVLGDMLELGAHSAQMHRDLQHPLAAANPDAVYLVGRHMQALADVIGPSGVAGHAHSVGELITPLLDSLAYGDAVMVKGSNGVGLGRMVEAIRARFG
ncbi:UDP-N-acetylmuramoyl-tripeptide--D-alanyl-D-alanine ligase [Devosia pacifica]|uniref:UDP-N-acetylmuramoyl-tripeptide--D-alanyl-D-alanine ligase n=1 Tax=Devosia pacifica TaxID=1335967 RepID=A0A918VQ31_9HYPH|nr:UDP-N-acetylmuramoyl-tripeptide--D-alanyl-D-alanine ligase [Devosia pacifica]GHA15886.1 UDP-N-acetylmuramoyl-tripeptide--D-alanyl-D-alanine ligase [Devosia pacifica]